MKQQDLKEFKCSAQDTIANLENLTKNAAGYCSSVLFILLVILG